MKPLQQGKKKLQKGFTLIELMIVVAIIGVLSAIAIPAYQNYVKKSEAATGLATVKGLTTNIDMYIQENSSFPTNDQTGFTNVGAASDMNSLGTLSFENISGAEGTVQFLFNGNSSISGNKVSRAKTSSGWKCTFDTSAVAVDSDELPKSCRP